jgi:hypothetical protein
LGKAQELIDASFGEPEVKIEAGLKGLLQKGKAWGNQLMTSLASFSFADTSKVGKRTDSWSSMRGCWAGNLIPFASMSLKRKAVGPAKYHFENLM